MSRSGAAARRSGDPRKRAAAAPAAPSGRPRAGAIVLAALVALALLGVALYLTLREETDPAEETARGHARTACDLTGKAQVAASGDTAARYAAAALLMDQAILESGRAAETWPDFARLDTSVQAVHTAAHAGRAASWQDALVTALEVCEETVGSPSE